MIGKDKKFTRAIVWLPAKLYEMAVRRRVAAYESGSRKSQRLNARVIAIGNITLGGTGKTPMVEYVARYLYSQSHRVAILTRGYGRQTSERQILNAPDSAVAGTAIGAATGEVNGSGDGSIKARSYQEVGDEPLMLARALPSVPIVIDKNRAEAGRWATEAFGVDVLVLDDAYQHLQLARDLNLLLIDASDPFGGFEMVPFGRLREPLSGLKRADAIIVTRADRLFDQMQTQKVIREYCGNDIPILQVTSSIVRLRHLSSDEVSSLNNFIGRKAAALCGIGNPQAFATDLRQAGINVVSENFFRDHHPFTQADLDRTTEAACRAAADLIITTEKDAMRLEGLKLGEVPVYAAQMEIQSKDESRLKSLLLSVVSRKRF